MALTIPYLLATTGTKWEVFRAGEKLGEYPTQRAALAAIQLARTLDEKSGLNSTVEITGQREPT